MPDQRVSAKNYVAVIDIGSNAVRLVIYDGLNRAPFRVHNERAICNLGAGVALNGKLDPDGRARALKAIGRFANLLVAMNITDIRAVATAAIRDASDGADFIAEAKRAYGFNIDVIDGDEEARLSALGVLANGTSGDGVIGDYGGGSLELIFFEDYQLRHKCSLPIGSHRLLTQKGREARLAIVEEQLARVSFLNEGKGRDFYALGGAWRSMAKAHMHMTGYPIRLLDHYSIGCKPAQDFASLLGKQNPSALERTAGLSKKRVRDMEAAALTMEILLTKMQPARVTFSGTGLREGLIFDRLDDKTQSSDALIASCAKVALTVSRYDDAAHLRALHDWIAPLFKEYADFRPLIEASCLLSDNVWFESEDYQADHAFEQILVLPLYGVEHSGRAFLAMTQYVRYKGFLRRMARGEGKDATQFVQRLMDERAISLAVVVGLAQRLGYLLSGGALTLLKEAELSATADKITLRLKSDALYAEGVEDALKALAAAANKKYAIQS